MKRTRTLRISKEARGAMHTALANCDMKGENPLSAGSIEGGAQSTPEPLVEQLCCLLAKIIARALKSHNGAHLTTSARSLECGMGE